MFLWFRGVFFNDDQVTTGGTAANAPALAACSTVATTLSRVWTPVPPAWMMTMSPLLRTAIPTVRRVLKGLYQTATATRPTTTRSAVRRTAVSWFGHLPVVVPEPPHFCGDGSPEP